MHQEREYPGRVVATALHNPDFVAYALAFGGYGAVVEKTADFPAAFAQARASGKPSIIHLKIDPEAISTFASISAIREKALAGPAANQARIGTDGRVGRRRCILHVNHRSLVHMPYRRTENVVRRLAEREEAILAAATAIAAEGGMAAVQIAAVAARAGIAAGTVYRYFPSKTDLVADLVAAVAGRELSAMIAAGNAAPGPLSALAACIATFAARALNERRLTWAVIGEPVDAQVDAMRLDFRQSLAAELEARIKTAIAGRHLPEQDAGVAAPAIVGALMEGLLGPLAPAPADAAATRAAVQSATLLALRALGVIDARARGLVAQCVLP